MTLLVPGSDPRTFRIAGGNGPTPGASAAFIPDYRGPNAGAIAIGQPTSNGTSGRVDVFYLDGPLDSIPDLTIAGESVGDLFGHAVSGVGDVNGDGFGDLVVGAPGQDAGTGRVYVMLGAVSPSGTPGATIDGSNPGDLFGSAVVGNADWNADLDPDIAVGAPGAGSGVGQVSICYGGPVVPTAISDVLIPTEFPSYAMRYRFGASLSTGDLTSDGLADLCVGAPGALGGRGRVHAYASTNDGLSPLVQIDGTDAFGQFGHALSIGGFSDGAALDLAVGAPGALQGRGQVTVYFGGSGFDATSEFSDTGEQNDDAFGYALAAGNLFPRADVPQILVGAPFAEDGGVNSGLAYIMAIPPSVDVEHAAVLLQSEGAPLGTSSIVDPSLPLRATLANGAAVNLLQSRVTLDGAPCGLRAVEGSVAVELLLPQSVADGKHRLQLSMVPNSGSTIATEFEILTARRFTLTGAIAKPQPAHGTVRIEFMMTRPGAYWAEVFDAGGRRIAESQPERGVAGKNLLVLSRLDRAESGVYFFRLRAEHGGQRVATDGRLVIIR